MERVTHREMRNNSGEVLRRVEGGESLLVTNRGRVVAVLSPPARSSLDELIADGSVRPATQSILDVRAMNRASGGPSTEEILDDMRGLR